jgi:hypothetical protein
MRLAIIGFALLAGTAHATSGNDLLQQCEQAEKFMNDEQTPTSLAVRGCLSYTSGFLDGTYYVESQTSRRAFCPPERVTNGQYIRVALKHMRENPAELHKPAAWLFGEAFRKAYPCK